ncbi:MAG: autotransporter outer membrane beta-barrel domain-containing protein [Proteobacteria bacterium]|nr:autotransporter outer membrane beta-barrel domain-containing protein [Candidatus Fonsibacter sp. PEL5]NKA17535.1 autotransporter outer membrane beta-barrel domain-containing protein [Candidatus Fonsibacter sp. PEL55]
MRVGGFIDGTVNKDHNPNMKLNSNSPMFGAFTRYNQHDQNFGLKGGVSAGYIDQDLKSKRVVTGTSEPGTGTSNLTTKGIQAEIQYGIDAASFLIVSPYMGYRNTQTTRDKYTEETSSTVTTPLTYNKIKQTEETVFTGIELKSHFHTTDKFATLNLGCEHTTKFSIDNLSTSGVSGTSDINLGSNIEKTRPVIAASLNQDLGTSGRLSLNFDRRQQVYSPTNSTNVALQYAVGF